MAQAVTTYRAASGASFDNEHDAWLDDLQGFFIGAGMSEGVARQMVRHIDDSRTTHKLGEILAGLEASRAPPTIAELVASGHLAEFKVAPVPQDVAALHARYPSTSERRLRVIPDDATGD